MGSDRASAEKVDLEVRRGEIYGFLGRNGAGKTTAIRMLLGLGEYADRGYAYLSLGNKQRTALALALVHAPELLRLVDSGTTIFMSSHILSEVDQLADRIGIIHEGRIVEEVDRREGKKAERARSAAGIRPLGITPVEESLERRFMRLTGGES